MVGYRWAAAVAGLGIVGFVSFGPTEAARVVAPSCPAPPASPTTPPTLAPTTPVDTTPSPSVGVTEAGGSQTITVSVLPGPLTLVTERAEIDLHAVNGQVLCGRLPDVRIIDARGNGDGWRVRWSVESFTAGGRRLPPSAVDVVPDAPSVVFGLPSGLFAGGGNGADRRVLFGAEPGTGGGTYETGATVEARLQRGRTLPNDARVVLRFVVVPHG